MPIAKRAPLIALTLAVLTAAAGGEDLPSIAPELERLAAATEQAVARAAAAEPLTPAEPQEPWLLCSYAEADLTAPACSACDDVPCCPACDECPRRGMYAFFGYDSWRGIQDDGWANNGLHTGLNFGTRLGPISDWTGIGFQLGGSVGVYNWNGTDYHLSLQDQATMQGFVTYGFFRKISEQSKWSFAAVQDWMVTSNYGIFAQNPTLSQWRGQVGYALRPQMEMGLWGAWRGQGDSRNVPGFGPTRWEPVQQLNVYGHYKFATSGADAWVWVGVPEHTRLDGTGGSLGDYIAGALAQCPLSDRLQLYALVTYMHPSARPGPPGSNDEAWCFATGLAFYFGGSARTSTLGGQCWMPQLPVANNGTFLVDTSQTY